MASQAVSQPQSFLRFSLLQRIQHIVLLTSFIGLAVTGLPQKFSLEPWAIWMLGAMGGIETVRVIHRVLATVLMVEVVYHGGEITYKLFVQRVAPSMLPTLNDLTDLVKKFLYNLRLRKDAPKLERYNYEEKLEYWALVWGMVIMIITGFMMWNPIATTRFLPGEFIPAAKVAHGSEALLAVLAILTWHFYNVHLRSFNLSMWTGRLNHKAMEEDHELELEAAQAGTTPQPAAPEVIRKRLRVFVPIAIVVSALLLSGIVWFVTFEQTAIKTIPAYNIEVVPPELQK